MNNVFFNHVYTIIDEKTYDAIKSSAFLKNEFCHCGERTNSSDKLSWTGVYLTGENTLIEFFSDKDKTRMREEMNQGDVGIAFSVDHEEEFEKIIKFFKQENPTDIRHALFMRNLNNIVVPWYYYVEFVNNLSMRPPLDVWIMAYHNDYLKSQGSVQLGGSVRKFYNKNCNTVPFDEHKLFKDIEEITLLLNDENKEKFVALQKMFGYDCQEKKDCTICSGPGIVFTLKSCEKQMGKLVKLQLSLNSSINKSQVYELGNSTLELANQKAIWTFE